MAGAEWVRHTNGGAATIAAVARQLDRALVYRAFVADGKRGAAGRVALVFGVSRQRVCQIVQAYEQQHPVVFAPRASLRVTQQATDDASDESAIAPAATAFDADELRYVAPPNAYLTPIPHQILRESAPFLEALIMSPLPDLQVQASGKVQVFQRQVALPVPPRPQVQEPPRLRPAESWLLLCAGMTALTVLVGIKVLSLGLVLLVVCLVMWSVRI